MKKIIFSFLIISIAAIGYAFHNYDSPSHLKSGTSDTSIPSDSNEAFDKMMQVLMHKRCVNCHPSGDTPRQGEDSHLHNFDVVRGDKGHGLAGYTCNTCHQSENNDFSGVPGAPDWALSPLEMAWEGKSRVAIARQMMDPKRNGGRSAHDIMEHLTEHELVLWAWEPGMDAEGKARETPPIPKDEYIAAVKEWIQNGAIIPEQ